MPRMTRPRRPRASLPVDAVLAALVVATIGCGAGATATAGAAPAGVPRAGAAEGEAAPAAWGPGFVVWESNRGGSFRIWRRDLSGGAARQLSPDEPGRDHCCAHISPDGRRVAYLSLPGGARAYLPAETPGVLRLIESDGRLDRVAAPAARAYGEHRAAIWWSGDELVYIDGEGATLRLDLSSAARTTITRGPARGEGWLVDPTGRWATAGTPTFSELGRDGRVVAATPLGGCQPYFDASGRFGVWAAGAGGPIDAIELATRRTFTLLAKRDPRLPADRGYLYFPMLSRDGSLLAFAASNGEHDHFRADYDVLAIEVEPATLAPVGRAVRISEHPAVDRFPDLHRARPPRRAALAGAATPAPPAPALAPGWPSRSDALALVWEGADRLNRRAPGAASEQLVASGRAVMDRRARMSFGGGSFALEVARVAEVVAALRDANALSLQLLLEPAALATPDAQPLVALATQPGRRGFVLRQRGRALELVLRTSETGPGAAPVRLLELPDGAPHHVAFTFSPGRLAAYLDGRPAGSTVVPGDFFHWRSGRLELGAEPEGAARFRGALSHLAIHARELAAGEVEADARRVLEAAAAAPPVPFAEVEARLVARSRPPTLAEISPYRQALVVEEWEVLRAIGGAAVTGRIRVARWSLLDGAPTPESAEPPGTVRRLRLEPHAAQPQLESVVLSDTLPPRPAGGPPLGFDVGWSGG